MKLDPRELAYGEFGETATTIEVYRKTVGEKNYQVMVEQAMIYMSENDTSFQEAMEEQYILWLSVMR